MPTFSPSNPNPSFPPDTELEAHFPQTIDGNPVTDVSSYSMAAYLCFFAGSAMVNQQSQAFGGGINFATLNFARASATVDNESVELGAFRSPGGEGNGIIQYIAQLVQTANLTGFSGAATTANVGGKSVYVFTDSGGAKSYAYATGDTVIFFNNVTDDQATKILSALP